MTRGLLGKLEVGLEKGAPSEDVGASIAAHLRALLNTIKGEAVSAPSFGIVDFTELVHSFPSSIQTLAHSIRATILEYEPRLKQVTVRHLPDEDPLSLKFEISGQLAERGQKGTVRFKTQVAPGGKVEVW